MVLFRGQFASFLRATVVDPGLPVTKELVYAIAFQSRVHVLRPMFVPLAARRCLWPSFSSHARQIQRHYWLIILYGTKFIVRVIAKEVEVIEDMAVMRTLKDSQCGYIKTSQNAD